MNGLNVNNVKEKIFTLPNGLLCCIIERRGFSENRAYACVNFGSRDTRFLFGGGECLVPTGTAHFLEHKMFDCGDGDASFVGRFAAISADCNAFTNFNTTAYHFGCREENYYDALSLLIEMLADSRFSDESVQNEKAVIAQEIMMYRDDPAWRAYFAALSAMYAKDGVNEPILGTVESIAGINAATLDLCRNAFYRPQNMALLCIGGINAEKVTETAEKAFDTFFGKTAGFNAEIIAETENAGVSTRYAEEIIGAAVPAVCVGFKDECSSLNDAASAVAAETFFDPGGALFNDLYVRGAINDTFSNAYFSGRGYGHAVFSGESERFGEICETVLSFAERAAQNGLNAEDADRAVKKRQGRLLRTFDNFEAFGMLFADCFAKRRTPFDAYNDVCALTADDVINRAKSLFVPQNAVFAAVK